MIRSTFAYLTIGLFVLIAGPFAMLWTLISDNSALLYALSRLGIRIAGWISGIRLNVRGVEKIRPGVTYVFLSNHQSNCDGPVLLVALPRDWGALIKKEMMKLPVLSLILTQAKFIPIERANARQAHEAIELGVKRLAEGKSYLAFPEGTRSVDRTLGRFKKGVFIMAIKAQTPVIPITISNSANIQPRGKYAMSPGRIEVSIHDPIETAGMTVDDRDRLIQLTRDAIESGFEHPAHDCVAG